jgi:hypothetical protein
MTVTMTPVERREAYAAIPSEIKAPALSLLAGLLEPVAAEIRTDFAADSENWWKHGHFHFGLAVRNQLRTKGFDADYFGVSNLDDIYVFLVEEALKLR